jgi:hypothetical protein
MRTADIVPPGAYEIKAQADIIFDSKITSTGGGGFNLSPHFVTGLIEHYLDIDAFFGKVFEETVSPLVRTDHPAETAVATQTFEAHGRVGSASSARFYDSLEGNLGAQGQAQLIAIHI